MSYRYKNYIPNALYHSIRQRNILTRLRISNVFKVFLEGFNKNTVKGKNIHTHDLKVKYISTLETLTKHFGQEVFQPSSLIILENEEMLTESSCEAGVQHEVLVSGISGIQWRKVSTEVRRLQRQNNNMHRFSNLIYVFVFKDIFGSVEAQIEKRSKRHQENTSQQYRRRQMDVILRLSHDYAHCHQIFCGHDLQTG